MQTERIRTEGQKALRRRGPQVENSCSGQDKVFPGSVLASGQPTNSLVCDIYFRIRSVHWMTGVLQSLRTTVSPDRGVFPTNRAVFKASTLWADAFYKLKCPSVCGSVCPCVCSLLRYRLTVFLPPTSRSRMSNIFRDSESLGKSNGKKLSTTLEIFFLEVV